MGFSVAVLNLSGFGVDPSSQMNMSVCTSAISFGVGRFCKCNCDPYYNSCYKRKEKKIGAVFGFGTL